MDSIITPENYFISVVVIYSISVMWLLIDYYNECKSANKNGKPEPSKGFAAALIFVNLTLSFIWPLSIIIYLLFFL